MARIRFLAARGEAQERLAEVYDVGLMTISDVILNKTWVGVRPENEKPTLQTVGVDKSRDNLYGTEKALRNLIRRWAACRNVAAGQRASALAFNYQPQDLVLVKRRERFDIATKTGKVRKSSRVVVAVVSPSDFYHVTDTKSDSAVVTARKPRRSIKPLPSDQLCWALTFEIVLRDELYTSERWAVALWHRDERNVVSFPQRAAEKLVRECRRRGLI